MSLIMTVIKDSINSIKNPREYFLSDNFNRGLSVLLIKVLVYSIIGSLLTSTRSYFTPVEISFPLNKITEQINPVIISFIGTFFTIPVIFIIIGIMIVIISIIFSRRLNVKISFNISAALCVLLPVIFFLNLFTANNRYAANLIYGLLLCYGIWMFYYALTGAFRINRKISAAITGLQAAYVIFVTISSMISIDTENDNQEDKFLKKILDRAKIKNELKLQENIDNGNMGGGNDDLRTKKKN